MTESFLILPVQISQICISYYVIEKQQQRPTKHAQVS